MNVTPGGVNSPVRAFGSVGGEPFFVKSASGAFVTDVDDNRYIDYVQSWGASILGHAHPAVIEAVEKAARRGTTYGAPTEGEVLLCERITRAVSSCEMVRLVSSGTEAAMTAIRLARAVTGRDRVVKFAGCYHGHSDALLAAGGSGVATLGLPGSAGVTKAAVKDTIVVPYNVVPEVAEDVACVIVEPVAANMGLVSPDDGFLSGLRRACDEAGALLVFDEVISGFRIGPAGAAGRFGIDPDLFCFGKVIGGGLPLAAIGGRRALMEELAPLGPVYQAGTLSGNPVATAAGLTTLELLDASVFDELAVTVSALSSGIGAALDEAGLGAQVPVSWTLFSVFFSDQPVRDYEGAKAAASNGRYARFFRGMLERGISLPPSPYEVMFCSLAHSSHEVEETITAARATAKEMAASE